MGNEHSQENDKLNHVFSEVDSLPLESQVKVVERLLGKNSGLAVVFGNNSLSGQTVFQINLTSKEEVNGILKAIAQRIIDEKNQPEQTSEE